MKFGPYERFTLTHLQDHTYDVHRGIDWTAIVHFTDDSFVVTHGKLWPDEHHRVLKMYRKGKQSEDLNG